MINLTTFFTRAGRIVKRMNDNLTLQGTTLLGANSGADDILDEYEGRRDLVPDVQRSFEQWAATVQGWNATSKGWLDRLIADLQADLNAPSSSPSIILPLLADYMVANSSTINASTIDTPTATPNAGNVGNGKLVLSKVNLDGVDDERIITEAVKVVCLQDSASGSTSSGGETFSITGYPKQSPNSYKTQGNGTGPVIRAGDAADNLLTNGTFETYTVTNTPDGWVMVGTVTTSYAQSATAHRGSAALSLKGNGVVTPISATQDISDAVDVNTTYALGVWLRKSGTVNAGSTLQVKVTGSGFTTAYAFNADPTGAGLTTSYVHYAVVFSTGATIPSDLSVVVSWTSANSAGATAVILVDDLVLQETAQFGHVQYAAFAGSTDFLAGDSFDVVTNRSAEGVFSAAFARWYDAQLPTDSGGSESVSDSLAT